MSIFFFCYLPLRSIYLAIGHKIVLRQHFSQQTICEIVPNSSRSVTKILPGRSTASNLINITTTIADELDSRKQVHVAYVDFQKSFDRIDRDVLLRKLVSTDLSKNLMTLYI